MTDDVLTRIQREMHERLGELRGAVDEHNRLEDDLRSLETAPEPPAIDPEPAANVVRVPVRPDLSRTRMVSPKVARLMHAPRRPALERSGVVRVGAGRLDSVSHDSLDEIDVEPELNDLRE